MMAECLLATSVSGCWYCTSWFTVMATGTFDCNFPSITSENVCYETDLLTTKIRKLGFCSEFITKLFCCYMYISYST